jgi:hypothetical protein
MYGSGFSGKDFRELSLRHAGVTAVTVHLIERSSEIDRRVVTLGSAERSFDYGQGVGASCEERAGYSGFLFQFLHHAEDVFCLCHTLYYFSILAFTILSFSILAFTILSFSI